MRQEFCSNETTDVTKDPIVVEHFLRTNPTGRRVVKAEGKRIVVNEATPTITFLYRHWREFNCIKKCDEKDIVTHHGLTFLLSFRQARVFRKRRYGVAFLNDVQNCKMG